MRSVTGTPDNPDDHAEWLNGPDEPEPVAPAVLAEHFSALISRLDRIRGVTQSAHRCRHGIDLERADCAPCLEATSAEFAAFFVDVLDRVADETKGAALAARFDTKKESE
jgi:hypothetical protein